MNQEKYELVITAEQVVSTDGRFNMDDLGAGNNYKTLDAYFKRADGQVIRRSYNKSEKRNTNQTMPRIACQVFENSIAGLSVEEKENFPICKYTPKDDVIRGIFTSVSEFKKQRNTIEFLIYRYDNGRQFVLYCWNIFSTIVFVQECLRRFGAAGDQFVLVYREKEKKEADELETESSAGEKPAQTFKGYLNPYSATIIASKNVIFRGAPGTGKSYLAREIATDIISNGYFDDYTLLSEEQKKQIEFVQFHPSFDYSDFVEGLRPCINEDGSMGFCLQDGVFKRFIARARKNYEDAQKPQEAIEKELSVQEAMADFFAELDWGKDAFETVRGNTFYIMSADDRHINISVPGNDAIDRLSLNTFAVRRLLEAEKTFDRVRDVTDFFGKKNPTQGHSYEFAIYKAIMDRRKKQPQVKAQQQELKKYVFIIDEINRGEISKIFGELFFAIDPGYRGRAGEVSTQYANLHENPEDKFFIPENVYVIGTMNDIDRSVDSFDFAMRRRFRFIELKADEQLEALSSLQNEDLIDEAGRRMAALNREIAQVDDLNENYQIGAAYFLKLKSLDFDQLWTDYLQPLLQEYIQGMYDEAGIMKKFADAYGYGKASKEDADEVPQD